MIINFHLATSNQSDYLLILNTYIRIFKSEGLWTESFKIQMPDPETSQSTGGSSPFISCCTQCSRGRGRDWGWGWSLSRTEIEATECTAARPGDAGTGLSAAALHNQDKRRPSKTGCRVTGGGGRGEREGGPGYPTFIIYAAPSNPQFYY